MRDLNVLSHRSLLVALPATILASTLSNLLTMFQTGSGPAGTIAIRAIENAGVFVILIGGLWLWNRRQLARLTVRPESSERAPEPAKALIAMVSAGGGRVTALAAAEHHIQRLDHLWLITTRTAEADALFVSERITALKPGIAIHPIRIIDDKHTIDEVKVVVEMLRRKAIQECGGAERDVICDFTGLTKHASAGMVLACAPRLARLQYVTPATKDSAGHGLTPGRPIEVGIAYQITGDEA